MGADVETADEAPPVVRMRDLHGQEHDLVTAQAPDGRNPLIVEVPGFGHFVGQLTQSQEPIVRLGGPQLLAGIAQPGPGGEPRLVRRDARKVDGGWEVELLPNSSGEDRLVVCVPDAALEPAGRSDG